MPTMPRDEDSSERHVEYLRRHERLARCTTGTTAYGERCTAIREALQHAMQVTKQAKLHEQDVRDDQGLLQQEGGDRVRTIYGRALELDRTDPAGQLKEKIFDGEGFGAWLLSDGGLSPENAATLAQRIAKLGDDHALAPFRVQLVEYEAQHKAGEDRIAEAVRARNLAAAEEELAQAEVRRIYEHNYLDARKQFGRAFAERIFPKMRRSKPAKTETPPVNEDEHKPS